MQILIQLGVGGEASECTSLTSPQSASGGAGPWATLVEASTADVRSWLGEETGAVMEGWTP